MFRYPLVVLCYSNCLRDDDKGYVCDCGCLRLEKLMNWCVLPVPYHLREQPRWCFHRRRIGWCPVLFWASQNLLSCKLLSASALFAFYLSSWFLSSWLLFFPCCDTLLHYVWGIMFDSNFRPPNFCTNLQFALCPRHPNCIVAKSTSISPWKFFICIGWSVGWVCTTKPISRLLFLCSPMPLHDGGNTACAVIHPYGLDVHWLLQSWLPSHDLGFKSGTLAKILWIVIVS